MDSTAVRTRRQKAQLKKKLREIGIRRKNSLPVIAQEKDKTQENLV